MSEKTYRVRSPLLHDGELYSPGDEVTLDETQIQDLIADGVIAALAGGGEKEQPADTDTDRQTAIVEAIGRLDPGSPDHYTKSGKPEIGALEELTGYTDITAAERDAAFAGLVRLA